MTLFEFMTQTIRNQGDEILRQREEIRRLREDLRMRRIEQNLEPPRNFVEEQNTREDQEARADSIYNLHERF